MVHANAGPVLKGKSSRAGRRENGRIFSDQTDPFGRIVFFDVTFKTARSAAASQDGLPWRPEKPRA